MKLAFKEMWRQKRKFSLIFVITLLIVLLSTLITGLADGLAYDNGASLRELDVETFQLAEDADGQLPRSFIELPTPETLTPLGVKPLTLVQGTVKQDATLFTLPADSDVGPELDLAVGDVLVDPSFLGDFALGDTIQDFTTGYQFTIAGTTDGRYSHAPVIWASMETWEAFQSHGGQPEYVSAWLGEAPTSLTALSKQEVVEAVPGYTAEQGTFTMMRGFLLFIGAFILTAFFYMLTLQKLPELGILKAIGIRPRVIGTALVTQVMTTVLVASLSAAVLTALVASFVPSDIPFRFEAGHVLFYSVIMFVLSLIGTLLPLWKLRHLDAADALGGTLQ
ncbi:ABC transporter permease [Exiguobacterium aurantiacum]|uniref:Putative hemin transport system permease protein HrtB n=1 Tax=Exiguobacterium aurantiacum TaxID=33987 RepID=A0ABY5FRV2_9BACL|nr:ABC transporter permease [Exiguobacterium aurantiacum]UTT44337.1 ABC transporter permease [Exiguobacterium aurantiacum]